MTEYLPGGQTQVTRKMAAAVNRTTRHVDDKLMAFSTTRCGRLIAAVMAVATLAGSANATSAGVLPVAPLLGTGIARMGGHHQGPEASSSSTGVAPALRVQPSRSVARVPRSRRLVLIWRWPTGDRRWPWDRTSTPPTAENVPRSPPFSPRAVGMRCPRAMLVEALAVRFAADGIGDRPALIAPRHRDGAGGGRASADADVQTLYAEAIMNTMPWDYWQKDGTPKPEAAIALKTLEAVIAANPRHPGAHHYYIHAVEASNDPDRAIRSADVLGPMMPSAGHMVHMPAHIYLRVGRYAGRRRGQRPRDQGGRGLSRAVPGAGALSFQLLPAQSSFPLGGRHPRRAQGRRGAGRAPTRGKGAAPSRR